MPGTGGRDQYINVLLPCTRILLFLSGNKRCGSGNCSPWFTWNSPGFTSCPGLIINSAHLSFSNVSQIGAIRILSSSPREVIYGETLNHF